MKKATIWNEKYREIPIEIINSGLHNEADSWCFYLYLYVEQFPTEMGRELWCEYEYTAYGTPLERITPLRDLEWHCGVTYYSRESQPDYPFKIIKVGCDYNHLWDEGHIFDEHSLLVDAKSCIDSLYEQYPNLKSQTQLWKEHQSKFPNKGDLGEIYNKNGERQKGVGK